MEETLILFSARDVKREIPEEASNNARLFHTFTLSHFHTKLYLRSEIIKIFGVELLKSSERIYQKVRSVITPNDRADLRQITERFCAKLPIKIKKKY